MPRLPTPTATLIPGLMMRDKWDVRQSRRTSPGTSAIRGWSSTCRTGAIIGKSDMRVILATDADWPRSIRANSCGEILAC